MGKVPRVKSFRSKKLGPSNIQRKFIRTKKPFFNIIGMKICARCKIPKDESEFSKSSRLDKYGHPYLVSYCRPCKNDYDKENIKLPHNALRRKKQRARWYQENKEHLQSRSRNRYQGLSKEQRKECIRKTQQWRKNHQDKLVVYRTAEKIKNRSNPQYKIKNALRARVRECLKGKKKSASTLLLLGCSLQEAKEYLESKFLPGMSWENHGIDGWHIDHIRPCSSFDLIDPEQQKKCFHYTNLQPLWSTDNLKKGDKIISLTA